MRSACLQTGFSGRLRLFCSSACLLFLICQHASAESKFPYEATVNTADVAVHSGPGSRFYLTGSLDEGQKVQVHRHDPGGWYMIAPPRGSYSLVRAEYVQEQESGQGAITENNVVVRVGSQLNDHHEVEQRRLMKGDQVKVLGQTKIEDRGRVVTMLRIEPPRGEFRWVKGDYLIPVSQQLREQRDSNPYTLPSNGVEIEPEPQPAPEEEDSPDFNYPIAANRNASNQPSGMPTKTLPQPQQSWDESTGVVGNDVDTAEIAKDRDILDALDRHFRSMIEKDVSQWNLSDLRHDYRKLQKSTSAEAISRQVDLRLQAMEKYRQIKAEYDELAALTSETDRRDARLAAKMRDYERQMAYEIQDDAVVTGQFPAGDAAPDTTAFLPDLGPAPGMLSAEESAPRGQFPSGEDSGTAPDSSSESLPLPSPGQTPSSMESSQTDPSPRGEAPNDLVGAGIVQQIEPSDENEPPYILLTPEGRFLAYVEPGEGVDLDAWLGKAIGLKGDRQRDPQLGTDLIRVSGLTKVQLETSNR